MVGVFEWFAGGRGFGVGLMSCCSTVRVGALVPRWNLFVGLRGRSSTVELVSAFAGYRGSTVELGGGVVGDDLL